MDIQNIDTVTEENLWKMCDYCGGVKENVSDQC